MRKVNNPYVTVDPSPVAVQSRVYAFSGCHCQFAKHDTELPVNRFHILFPSVKYHRLFSSMYDNLLPDIDVSCNNMAMDTLGALPAEVRLHIYDLVFSTSGKQIELLDIKKYPYTRDNRAGPCRISMHYEYALLAASKTVRREALDVFVMTLRVERYRKELWQLDANDVPRRYADICREQGLQVPQ